jgi:hypothetical protein
MVFTLGKARIFSALLSLNQTIGLRSMVFTLGKARFYSALLSLNQTIHHIFVLFIPNI